jgi:CRP/FNR family transcriptional regulator
MEAHAPQPPLDAGPSLAAHSLLRLLPERERSEFAAQGEWRSYERNDVLYQSGDPADLVWFVMLGWIRLHGQVAGTDGRTLGYRGPGSVVGDVPLFGTHTHQHHAVVHDEARCLVHSRHGMHALLQAHPSVLSGLLRGLVRHSLELERDFSDVAISDTRTRLARILVTLGQRHGVTDAHDTCRVQVSVTHQELAHLVRAARETITRLLPAFKNLKFDGNTLTLRQWTEFQTQYGPHV